MNNDMECRAALYKKLNAFRADVIQCDWKDDKMVSLGGAKGYPYLSSDKIIKNLAPLLVKHGIELDVEFSDLVNAAREGSSHWTVKASITFTDVETGFTTVSCAYGEGQDSQDKGVAKAQTAAFKKCLSARCMIADGIDPDAVDIFEPKNYYKKSAEEQEEVKSKVLSAAVKSKAEVKEEPKPIEELKVEIPEKKEPEAVKVEDAPVEVRTEAPKEEPKGEFAAGNGFVPSVPQKRVLDNITDTWERLAKAGKVTAAEYNEMSMARISIKGPADVIAFANKYKRVDA